MQAGEKLEITPDVAVEELQRDLGLSINDLAAALQVEPRTVQRWRVGNGTRPQREARHRLVALLRLRQGLHEFFESAEYGRDWLNEPSRYLGWMTPVDAIRAGQPDRAEAALEVMREGMLI